MRRISAFLLLAIGLVGCAHQPDIKVNYDKDASFDSLKTYSIDPIEESGTQNRAVDGKSIAQLITDSINSGLQQKGLVQAAPDLANFHVHCYSQIQFKRADVAPSSPSAMAESRNEAAANPIPAGPSGSDTPMQYAEGTIIIDIINPQSGKSIWRAAGVGVMREGVDPTERAERLNQIIHKMLADFPPKAK